MRWKTYNRTCWMRCEILWHGKWKWNVMMLSHEVKQKQVLGKELVTSPKWREPTIKHKAQKQAQNKHMPLQKTQTCQQASHFNT